MEWFKSLNLVVQALIATLFSYAMTALGASLVFFFKRINKKILDIMLGMASGIMIAASFWSLLNPAIELASEIHQNSVIIPTIGFIVGGLFVIGGDILLGLKFKIESKRRKNLLLVSAVTMHNIPEGMAIGVAFGTVGLLIPGAFLIDAILLALGIGIQNFPEGACVAMPLRSQGYSRSKAFFIGQASGIVEVFAGLLGVLFALTVRTILPFLLAFSAGAMIAVVCSELIPEAFEDNKILAALGVIFGFVTMMVLDVTLG